MTSENITDRYVRVPVKHRPPEERKKDFDTYVYDYTPEEAAIEASRCFSCGVCIKACPVRLDIPGYLMAAANGDVEEGLSIIFRNLPLPLICGTVCTHVCEDACIVGKKGDALAIRHVKRFISESVKNYADVIKPEIKPSIGKKVAIIGAGPAGLTAAYYLALEGISATIFEALDVPGGMMTVGIPRYRLSMDVINKEVSFIESLPGVEIKYGTRVGSDISFEELQKNYDAIFIGAGNHKPRMVGCEVEDNECVFHAIDYLKRIVLGEKILVDGKKVLVIGGGFTALDAARTSVRLGASYVSVFYRRRKEDRPSAGTSNGEEEFEEAVEEGVDFIWMVTPFDYVQDPVTKKLKGVKYWKNEMIEPEDGGRAKPQPMKDQEYFIECDYVIEATGQTIDFSFLPQEIQDKLEMDWNNIKVDKSGMTSIPGVFAGGDAVNEKKDIVSAAADGKTAAKGIVRYLKK